MACSISFVSLFFNKYPETSYSIVFLIYNSSSYIVIKIILVFLFVVSLFFNKYSETSYSIAFLIYTSYVFIVNTIIFIFSVYDKIFLLALNPFNPPDNDQSINTIPGSYLIPISTASIPLSTS